MRNPALKRLSTQLLDISIDAMEHTWNIYALRTVRFALTTTYTMVGLADSRDSAVVAYEIPALQALEILLLVTLGDIPRIYGIIIMAENCRDVDTVRAWHTISTGRARNGRVVFHKIRHLLEERNLLFGKRLEMAESLHVLYQRIHRRHTAQHSENARVRAAETECP